MAEGLRRLILYDTHLAEDGRGVSYTALMWDPAFADYVTATGELQKVGRRAPGLGCRALRAGPEPSIRLVGAPEATSGAYLLRLSVE